MCPDVSLSAPIVFLKSSAAKPVDHEIDLAEAKADLSEALLNDPNSPEIAALAAKVAQLQAAVSGVPAPAQPGDDDQSKAAAKVSELVAGHGEPIVVKAAQTLQEVGLLDGLDGLSSLRAVVDFAKQSLGDDELMKATVLREITVPAYTRTDGAYVPEHRKRVHVNPNRSRDDIIAGRGSHSQREAHARLSRMPDWHTLPPDHQHAHILSHATAIQNRRTMAAAISGWRSRAREGRNPTPSQWEAFNQLPLSEQTEAIARVRDVQPDLSFLQLPGGGAPAVPVPAPAPTPPTPVAQVANEHVNAPPADPLPQPETEAIRAAMTAVPIPDGVAHWSNSPTNEGCRRRIRQLQEMAAAGDLDGVTNFSTSRTRANYAVVDDYRTALLAAAHEARQPVHQPPQAATGAIPAPPVITGANPNNTALLAAQRKVQALYAAAQSADPVPAIIAIPTSRGNGYMNRADDYKTALLQHFGYDHAGQATRELAHTPPEPVAEPTPPPAAPSRRARAVRSNPAVPPERDPTVAANPQGLTEAQLGFVPRPNVPLDWRVTREGVIIDYGTVIRWPDARFRNLAIRYLAQSATLQNSARTYLTRNASSLAPVNAYFEAERARLRQAATATQTEQTEAQRRVGMEATRQATTRFVNALEQQPDLLKPQSVVGGNIFGYEGDFEGAGRWIGNLSAEAMKDIVGRMVADYGQGVRFTTKVFVFDNKVTVTYSGNDGTKITREFRRNTPTSKLYVYHALFTAGRRGQGAGKALFRCSMGVYKALGVSKINVYANIDVGGYAWAKYGFKIEASEWQRLANQCARQIGQLGMSQEGYQRLLDILREPNPEAIFMLADFKANERAIGKQLLLGTSWHGTLDLENKSQYRRCIGYISQGRG